ncbi:MAG: hypothetical protein Kow00109_12740 [Acidobacteriota bacterium]
MPLNACRYQVSSSRLQVPGLGEYRPHPRWRRLIAAAAIDSGKPVACEAPELRSPGTPESRAPETSSRRNFATPEPGVCNFRRLRQAGGVLAVLFLFPIPLISQPGLPEAGDAEPVCIVLQGLGGTEEFDETFSTWSEKLAGLCRDELGAATVHLDGRQARREELLPRMEQILSSAAGPIWFFLVGHGNWDGRAYRFNIRGPDLKTEDFVNLFGAAGERPAYVVLGTGASAPLAEALQGAHRIILAATRSPGERYPPLFFSFFLEGATSAEADRNMDRRVSLEELYAFCRDKVEAWYRERNQIPTEHPTLHAGGEDAPLAALAYLSRPPERSYRTLEAMRLAPERTRLEREIEALKLRKAEMDSEEYYRQLEQLLLELARLNQHIRELEGEP